MEKELLRSRCNHFTGDKKALSDKFDRISGCVNDTAAVWEVSAADPRTVPTQFLINVFWSDWLIKHSRVKWTHGFLCCFRLWSLSIFLVQVMICVCVFDQCDLCDLRMLETAFKLQQLMITHCYVSDLLTFIIFTDIMKRSDASHHWRLYSDASVRLLQKSSSVFKYQQGTNDFPFWVVVNMLLCVCLFFHCCVIQLSDLCCGEDEAASGDRRREGSR